MARRRLYRAVAGAIGVRLTLGCGHRTLRILALLDATEREISTGAGLLSEAMADAA